MIDEIHIWSTANVLIDTEDDRAAVYAAQRADGLLDAGDAEGAVLWRRIKAAIEALTDQNPPDRPSS